MKKGIVMEVNETCLTLLTPDGQFLQAKKQKQPYTLGEEILFSPISQKKSVTRFFGVKQLSIAAAALFIFAGTMIPGYESNKAYAYMSMDVNPSLELGINKQMQVVKLTAYNADGKRIISHIGDWEKQNITEFTQKVLREMKKEGYLNDHHSMLISTVHTENPEAKIEKQLTKNMGKIKELAKESDLQVTVVTGTEKEMEKAHKLGITTGKYKEAKIEKKNKMEKDQRPSTENNGSEGQLNGSDPAAEQEENSSVPPNTPGQNNGSPGNSSTNESQVPPGQLKKEVETPTSQWKQEKTEPKSTKNDEKKSSVNNGQEKKAYSQENGKKKD
jgi:hypothetical protein